MLCHDWCPHLSLGMQAFGRRAMRQGDKGGADEEDAVLDRRRGNERESQRLIPEEDES